HIGDKNALLVLAVGSDPVCHDFLRTADSKLAGMKSRSQGTDPMIPAPVEESHQRLVINTENRRILLAHLTLACGERPEGLSSEEVRDYWGECALDILLSDRRFRRRVSVDSDVFVVDSRPDKLSLDFSCVEWDEAGPDSLVPVVLNGTRIGHLEREILPPRIIGGVSTVLNGERVTLSQDAGQNGQVNCSAIAGGYIGVGERLSRLNIKDVKLLQDKGNGVMPLAGQNHAAKLIVAKTLVRVQLEEKLVAYADYRGYGHVLADSANTRAASTGASVFSTTALVMGFEVQGESYKDGSISREIVHTLKHLLKLAIRNEYRLASGELESFIPAPGELDGYIHANKGAHSIVFYDDHPEGDCYARALLGETSQFWMRVMELAYELMVTCPCEEGCWHCLVLPDCRDPFEQDTIWYRNHGLDKRGTMNLLGRMLDHTGHEARMLLKYGVALP
ncbi:MAG: DUF1998 domain-containing protein, partial [bacterium]